MTDAETIRAAAQKIREQLAKTTNGPWWYDESQQCWRLHGVLRVIPAQGRLPERLMSLQILKAPKMGTPYMEYWPTSGDADHIATWHPGVAEKVADMLDRFAWLAKKAPGVGDQRVGFAEVLAVARAVLGQEARPC